VTERWQDEKAREGGFVDISFAKSRRSTVGIEWEIALVERDSGNLVSVADEILATLRLTDGSPHPQITGELLLNTLELISGVHHRVGDAVAELETLLDEMRTITDPLGIEGMCAGTHPFGEWSHQKVTNSERYQRLIDRTQWWGRNMMIWGIHVHVGVEERWKVIPLLGGLLTYFPHLQALSASSPFWAGLNTGYASNRTLLFQQLPTAGLPWQIADWADYENCVADLTRAGIIDDFSEVRWDIRPSPRWGTLEMRACDGLSSAQEIGSIAALVQCLVEHLSGRLDAGETLPTMQPWFVRENKWRGARYGLDAEIILDSAGTQRPVVDDLRDLLVTLAPTAERLSCEQELDNVKLILKHGASYQRQLRVAEANNGSLQAVVASLTRELREGLCP
jgi:carboxylate-amine ligase